MRVLVDARVIQDHFPGIGRYVFNLLRAMGPMVPGEVLALVDPGAVNTRYDLDALARVPHLRLIPTSIPVFGLSSQRALPSLIRELRPDVVHFPYYVRPLRVDAPTVLTLYDVIPRRFPQYFPRLTRWKIEVMKRAAMGRSQGFVAISRRTAEDFVALYGVSSSRITVTPLAPDPMFYPREAGAVEAFRQRVGLPQRYVLYVGANKPHKNVVRLVRAWHRAGEMGMGRDVRLVVAGHWDDRYPEARELARALGVMERVVFWGPVSGEDLPWLYAGALAFLFPSLYEGFGLPVLEAMASGVPVGCSRAPGLEEVAGEAALTFDPYDVEAMAAVMVTLVEDAGLRVRLRAQGLEHAAGFTWERTARGTMERYGEVVGGS